MCEFVAFINCALRNGKNLTSCTSRVLIKFDFIAARFVVETVRDRSKLSARSWHCSLEQFLFALLCLWKFGFASRAQIATTTKREMSRLLRLRALFVCCATKQIRREMIDATTTRNKTCFAGNIIRLPAANLREMCAICANFGASWRKAVRANCINSSAIEFALEGRKMRALRVLKFAPI